MRTCLREGMHYYYRIKKLPQRARSLAAAAVTGRSPPPTSWSSRRCARTSGRRRGRSEYLHGHAGRAGRVERPVTLGRAQLEGLVVGDRRVPIDGRGRHRAEVVAVRELERPACLCLFCDSLTGHYGRVFNCWYQFEPECWRCRASPAPRRALVPAVPGRPTPSSSPSVGYTRAPCAFCAMGRGARPGSSSSRLPAWWSRRLTALVGGA